MPVNSVFPVSKAINLQPLVLAGDTALPAVLTIMRQRGSSYVLVTSPQHHPIGLFTEHGPAALELLQQRPEIDLLFTNVIMPGGLNGRELADAAHRLRPQLRVLYTSGYTENVLTHQEGPEAEIQLLHKPYQRAELARKIRQTLADG